MYTKQQIYYIIESKLKTCPNRDTGYFKYTERDITASKYYTPAPGGEWSAWAYSLMSFMLPKASNRTICGALDNVSDIDCAYSYYLTAKKYKHFRISTDIYTHILK